MKYLACLLQIILVDILHAQPNITVTLDDFLLTEHIESLFKNRVPEHLRLGLEREIIRIIGNSLRNSDPSLSEEDIDELAKRRLQNELDEMEREDREDYPELYEESTDDGFFE